MHYYYVCDCNLIKINIISYSFICFQHYIFINLFNATHILVYSTSMLSNILWRNVMSTHTVEQINYLLCVLLQLLWQHGQRWKKTLQQPGFLSVVLKWSLSDLKGRAPSLLSVLSYNLYILWSFIDIILFSIINLGEERYMGILYSRKD